MGRLLPKDWDTGRPYHFGDGGLSWLDLEHWDAEDRVRAALGLDVEKDGATTKERT
jgi:hypothetical protein